MDKAQFSFTGNVDRQSSVAFNFNLVVLPPLANDYFRAIASSLTEEHSSISTDPGIFGGMPHIKNVRLSVGDVLSKLYVYGSIQAILDDYSPDVNEDQIKEAIAYAQDFLEAACNPR